MPEHGDSAPDPGYRSQMPISDSLRDLLGDPRSAAMLRDRAERVLRLPITIFTEGDILRAWSPVIGPELARELDRAKS